MFVISIKDVLNFSKKIVVIGIAMVLILFSFKNLKIINVSNLIEKSIVFSEYFKTSHIKEKSFGIKKVLSSELLLISDENKKEKDIKNNNEIEVVAQNKKIEELKKEEPQIDLPVEKVDTKVIDTNNKIDTYTDIIDDIKIKNESIYDLSQELAYTNFELSNKEDIIIYHTHTCESYTPTVENSYEQTGNYRTTDLNYTVARVGDELTNYLKSFGFNVLHDKTFHDFPAYTGSYTRGLITISNLLKNNNSEMVIDLHRDALREFKFLCTYNSNR